MVYNFEELIIWQQAKDVARKIYILFQDNRDFGFKDQIQRAAVSIMNNISEGFQRNKFAKDNKQFINFLNIAYGSCAEVRNMLYLANEITYLSQEDTKELQEKVIGIECKIEVLIKKLQDNQNS
jgi:four helix bundle protein